MSAWQGEVHVTDDPAADAAERLTKAAAAGQHICLTGGSTPKAAYELAAGADVDWSSATLWFGDDRCVPPDHEFSNYAMAEATLLDRIAGGQPTVHRIEGELGPAEGAAAYERTLASVFGDDLPEFDLLFLGLGPDAHTASLFPGADQLGERERRAVGVEEPGMAPLVSRVTLTLPVLNAARAVVFLVSGADKADAVARAFSGRPDPNAPASLVAPTAGSLTLVADPPAVERLGS
ncbi:MAG: 6-phosphogluconolactonase [Thermoleophilaceae bacterium]